MCIRVISTGIAADHTTLTDLQGAGLTGTSRAVAAFYPQIFSPELGPQPEQELRKSIHMAREVLSGWR